MAMTDRPAPRRTASPPPKGGGSRRARGSGPNGDATGPPVASFAAVAAVLAFTLVAFWLGDRVEIGILETGREIDFNTFGYAAGLFVSIFAMHRFLKADGKARATRRYSEWRLLKARSVVVWITLASWLAGVAHLLFWARDLTRP